jgi:hypothetical protein
MTPCTCSNGGVASGFVQSENCMCDCADTGYEGDFCQKKEKCTVNGDGDKCANGEIDGFEVDGNCSCRCEGERPPSPPSLSIFKPFLLARRYQLRGCDLLGSHHVHRRLQCLRGVRGGDRHHPGRGRLRLLL